MGRLLIAALPCLAAACSPMVKQDQVPFAAAPGLGTAQIILLGDYVGRQIRLSTNGEVFLDRSFNYPPAGADDSVPVFTPAGDRWVRVEIEGCSAALDVRVTLEPSRKSPMIFDGCSVRALPPE